MSYQEGPMNYLRTGSINHAIRSVVDENGTVWMLAMDVAELFEMLTADLVSMVGPSDRVQIDLRNNMGGNHLIRGRGNLSRVWGITARGMSHIIMKSRHPLAMAINDWMYDVVLPALIMHGKFVVSEGELADIREALIMVPQLKEQVELLRIENRMLWEHSDATAGDYVGLDVPDTE